MKLTLEVAFTIGQLVYLRNDLDQLPRFVVSLEIRPGNEVIYDLQHGDRSVTSHSDFEISDKPDVIMTSTN